MLLHIILGDFSGDGHSITEKRFVELSVDIEPDVLYENYQRNVARFGFRLDDIANEYEEPYMPREKWDVLATHGLSAEILPDKLDDTDSKVWVWRDSLVAITMFFYLYGLDDTITWDHYNVESVPLNGFYGMAPKGAQSIGYGLYST